jgi:hypothetical protein
MKKTILSWLLISSSFMVFAQIDTTRRNTDTTGRDTTNMYNSNVTSSTDSMGVNNNMNNNMNSTTSSNAYNAYGTTSVTIPYRAQMNLQKDYPMVTSNNISWTQQGEWYHGTYMNNGRYSHIYYDDRGNTWTVSMPVIQSYVPDDIVNKATTMFGPMIYDVTTLKGDSAHSTIYQIRTIENGQVKAQWIGEDGSSIMDPFRSDVNTSTNAAMDNGNMNNIDSNNMNRNNMNMDSSNMNMNNVDSTMHNMDNMNNMDSTGHNMNMNNNTDSIMNNKVSIDSTMKNAEGTKVKIKTETSDGKETKTKIKDGKVKKDD